VVTHAVEKRLAHIESRTIEHDRIGAMLDNQIVDGGGISRCEDLVT